jgi:hypothetical protein
MLLADSAQPAVVVLLADSAQPAVVLLLADSAQPVVVLLADSAQPAVVLLADSAQPAVVLPLIRLLAATPLQESAQSSSCTSIGSCSTSCTSKVWGCGCGRACLFVCVCVSMDEQVGECSR